MTAGAIYQLSHGYSDRMAFLCLNPQITFFKSVYRKYTNFAMEYITKQFDSVASLSFTQDTTLSINISRDGDLVKDMYLLIDLPDIYSINGYDFRWIERIGEYIISDIVLQIDNNISIDHQYGEWYHIINELTLDPSKRVGYNRMIGNIPELYDPSNAPGNGGIYPDSGISNGLIPSIVGRRLSIPLQFWFNKLSTSAFPLIAIQRATFNIIVTLRALQELYTVIDVNGNGTRVRPYTSDHYIGNFLGGTRTTVSSLDIYPQLEVNYIFLDEDERKQFAISSHEYLITQIQRVEYIAANGMTNPAYIDLRNLNKPITELIFIVRRSDLENVNQWSNFTNWNTSVPPYTIQYTNPNGPTTIINTSNFKYYKYKENVQSAQLMIDGNIITDGIGYNGMQGKDSTFFNGIINWAMNNCIPSEGIYVYSFSLSNNVKQPDGAINMSTISTKNLQIYLTNIGPQPYTSDTTYNYNIYVYAVNLEILRILGGMANLAYSN